MELRRLVFGHSTSDDSRSDLGSCDFPHPFYVVSLVVPKERDPTMTLLGQPDIHPSN